VRAFRLNPNVERKQPDHSEEDQRAHAVVHEKPQHMTKKRQPGNGEDYMQEIGQNYAP
jgi:hypothetical protein